MRAGNRHIPLPIGWSLYPIPHTTAHLFDWLFIRFSFVFHSMAFPSFHFSWLFLSSWCIDLLLRFCLVSYYIYPRWVDTRSRWTPSCGWPIDINLYNSISPPPAIIRLLFILIYISFSFFLFCGVAHLNNVNLVTFSRQEKKWSEVSEFICMRYGPLPSPLPLIGLIGFVVGSSPLLGINLHKFTWTRNLFLDEKKKGKPNLHTRRRPSRSIFKTKPRWWNQRPNKSPIKCGGNQRHLLAPAECVLIIIIIINISIIDIFFEMLILAAQFESRDEGRFDLSLQVIWMRQSSWIRLEMNEIT